jgi:hypothetical protein
MQEIKQIYHNNLGFYWRKDNDVVLDKVNLF